MTLLQTYLYWMTLLKHHLYFITPSISDNYMQKCLIQSNHVIQISSYKLHVKTEFFLNLFIFSCSLLNFKLLKSIIQLKCFDNEWLYLDVIIITKTSVKYVNHHSCQHVKMQSVILQSALKVWQCNTIFLIPQLIIIEQLLRITWNEHSQMKYESRAISWNIGDCFYLYSWFLKRSRLWKLSISFKSRIISLGFLQGNLNHLSELGSTR